MSVGPWKQYWNQFSGFENIDDQSKKSDFRDSRAQIPHGAKHRIVTTVTTIVVRFQIGLAFWLHYSIIKNSVTNLCGKTYFQWIWSDSRMTYRNGRRVRLKSRNVTLRTTVFLRLIIQGQFWKYQQFLSISVYFLFTYEKNIKQWFSWPSKGTNAHQKPLFFILLNKRG